MEHRASWASGDPLLRDWVEPTIPLHLGGCVSRRHNLPDPQALYLLHVWPSWAHWPLLWGSLLLGVPPSRPTADSSIMRSLLAAPRLLPSESTGDWLVPQLKVRCGQALQHRPPRGWGAQVGRLQGGPCASQHSAPNFGGRRGNGVVAVQWGMCMNLHGPSASVSGKGFSAKRPE